MFMSICPYVRSLSTDIDTDTDMNMDIRTYEHGHVAVKQDLTKLTGHFRRLFTLDVLSHFILNLYVSLDVLSLYVLTYYSLCIFRRLVCIRFVTLYVLSLYFVVIHFVFRRFVVIRSVTQSMATVWPNLTTARRLSTYVQYKALEKVGYFRRESTKHVMKSHAMSTFSSVIYGFKSLQIIKFIKIKTSEEINNLIDT
jgi:hypothetical protein